MNDSNARLEIPRRGRARATCQPPSRLAGLALAAALAAVFLLGSCQHHASPQATAQPVARLRASTGAISVPNTAALFRDQAGMYFVLLPEPASNLARVDVRYRSGAGADPEGKSGLAHLVEHLTFHLRDAASAPTLADRLSRDALVFNAYTSWDETHYFATALAPRVDALIAIESDRLRWGCEKLSNTALVHERHVVERELESKRPATLVWDQLRRAAFASGHPYHRSAGGHPAQLTSLSRADACQLIDDQYRPDNAIMVVSGQIDVAAVKATLEARYGTLSNVGAIEPLQAEPAAPRGSTTQTLRADVSSPALVVLIASPPWGSPACARNLLALDVFAERLAQRVQADDAVIATGPVHLGGWNDGLRGVFVQVRSEDDLDHAARLVDDLRADPLFGLGDNAFSAARARFQAGLIRAHDSFSARAVVIADALQYAGERGIDSMRIAVANALRGQIEATIRQGFDHMHMIRVLPAGDAAQTSGVGLAGDSLSATQSRDLDAADSGHAVLSWVPAVDDREADRDLALPSLPSYPPIVSRRLANGLRVVLLQRSGYPMVYARMLFAVGQRAAPADREGLPELAALLRSPGMSAPWSQGLMDDLARVASLPVAIDALVEPEATVFSGSSPSTHASALLWNMHLHVRYGGYVGLSDIGKVLWRKYLNAIAERRRTSVEGIMSAVVEGDASSERALEALKTTVSRLQPRDLSDHAARSYRPDNGTLIVAGAFDAQPMMAMIEELFADWAPQAAGGLGESRPTQAQVPSELGGQHVLLADAARKQPRVIAIYPGVLDHDNPAAAQVLRAILETRLSRALREVLAATYDVSVRFRGNALVIDTELGGPRASLSVAKVRAIVDGLLDDQLRTDFILARRKSVEQALANSMSAALLIERASRLHHAGASSDPLDARARDIARLRPSDIATLVEQRMQAHRASLIIVAPKEQGVSLFRSIGIDSPRIVE